jgi:transcriptional regulator with XRE-family HTH domain
MDERAEIRDFLTTRRARVSPESVGLPAGRNRRVPGLRRSEVAALAGLSVEYYSRLERGDLGGASDQVLEALGSALRLDEAEQEHLANLAQTASRSRPARRAPRSAPRVRPSLQAVLDAVTGAAAFITNQRQDMIATNHLARALYSPMYRDPRRPVNHSRFIFLDPAATTVYPDWERAADINVAILRTESGRFPRDQQLAQLIGELSMRSDAFRTRWAAHNVRRHITGTKVFDHPAVGELQLSYETMALPGDPGLTLTVYTAVPDPAAEDGLRLLGTWAATHLAEDPEGATHP